jgi:hypothetical protein
MLEVEHRHPVLAQNVQADMALKVNVGVIDLMYGVGHGLRIFVDGVHKESVSRSECEQGT